MVNDRFDVNADDKGWRVIDIHVPDVSTHNVKQSASGAPGSTFLGADIEDRDNISILFDYYATDLNDLEKQKSEILRLFNSGPMRLYIGFIGADRYLEVVKDSIEPSRISHRKGRISVELSTINLPYFVSVGDSQSFTDLGEIAYESVSHIDLDHRYTDTEIKVTVPSGTSGHFLEIAIDDQVWRYNKAVSAGQTLTLKDGAVYIGKINVIEDATKNVLVIPPGLSTIKVRGAVEYKLTVDTKYYYY